MKMTIRLRPSRLRPTRQTMKTPAVDAHRPGSSFGKLSSEPHVAGLSQLWRITAAASSIVALFAGCSGDSTADRADATRSQISEAEIARVGDVVITRQVFEREWNRRTNVRSKEEMLQEMIQFESVLAKARAAGVDHDLEVVAAFHRMVVGKFQENELQRRGVDSRRVSESEIQTYYQEHSERFTTPKQVRVGLIRRKASTKASPAIREELRQEAETLWNQAKQASDDSFRQLAVQHSDDQATRYAGGDTGWFTPEQTTSRWESDVINAALALSAPGDLAPLIETESGFYVVKLLGTQPASRRPLAEVRDGIEYQLRLEKMHELRQKFFDEMRAALPIEINRVALESIPDRALQTATSRPPSLPK